MILLCEKKSKKNGRFLSYSNGTIILLDLLMPHNGLGKNQRISQGA